MSPRAKRDTIPLPLTERSVKMRTNTRSPLCLWQDDKFRVVRRVNIESGGTEVVVEQATMTAMDETKWDKVTTLRPGDEAPESRAMFHVLDKIATELSSLLTAMNQKESS